MRRELVVPYFRALEPSESGRAFAGFKNYPYICEIGCLRLVSKTTRAIEGQIVEDLGVCDNKKTLM